MRTPHGDADVRIDADAMGHEPSVADVVADVTGQATPRVVAVDERPVESTRPLLEVVRHGSVIDSDPRPTSHSEPPSTVLSATSGPGSRRTFQLEPGRYRLGPGRRINAAELADAPVESAAVLIDVTDDGRVTVTPGDHQPVPMLGGRPLTATTPWPRFRHDDPSAGHLVVGGRGFRLDTTPPTWQPAAATAGPAAVVGVDTDGRPLTIDPLAGVAVTGPRDLALDALRTLCLSVAEAADPQNISIVVVTTDDDAALWESMKWVPHVRHGSSVEVLVGDAAAANWLDGRAAPAVTSGAFAATTAQRTLLVIDAPRVWRQQQGVLRSIVIDPPSDVVLAVAADHSHEVPPTTGIELRLADDRPGAIVDGDGSRTLLPLLVDASTAEPWARRIALDRDTSATDDRSDSTADAPDAPDLLDLLDERPPAGWSVAIGRGRNGAITLDASDDRAIDIVAPRQAVAADMATTIALSLCLSQPPEELWLIDATGPGPSAVPALADIPNLVVADGDPSIVDRRFLQRLDALLRAPMRPARVLLIAADTSDGARAADLAHLAELCAARDGLQLVSVRERAVAVPKLADRTLRSLAGTHIDIVDRAGVRSATVTIDEHPPQWFTPHSPRRSTDRGLTAPFVVSRAPTPLERRLQRRIDRTGTTPPDVARTAQLLRDAAPHERLVPQLRPPPIPSTPDAGTLRAGHPGDGVPIGVLDRPEVNEPAVWWWVPGQSVLLVGGVRSGVREVFRSMLDGIAERLAPDDVTILAALATQSTRRAADRLPHCQLAVSPTDSSAMTAMVDALEHLAGTVALEGDTDVPRHLVLIDDLGAARRALDAIDRGRLDSALARIVGNIDTADIVATVATIADAGPLADIDRRAIGALGDPDEAFRLGVPEDVSSVTAPGRVWVVPDATIGVVAANTGERTTTDQRATS